MTHILQNIITTLTAILLSLSAQVGNLSQSIPPSSQLGQVAASTSGLVGYWNFDEGSGSTAGDSAGNGNSGTISGATWTTGKVGSGALNFTGSNYVSIPTINLGNTFSVSVWVNPTSGHNSAYNRIVETAYDTGLYLGVNNDATKFKIIIKNGQGSTGSCGFAFGCAEGGTVATGWKHITATYDGFVAKLYIDGSFVASDTFTAPGSTSLPLYLGRLYYSNQNNWKGDMDEVRVYNRVLSSSEVLDIYNDTGSSSPAPTPAPNPSPSPAPIPTPVPAPTPTPPAPTPAPASSTLTWTKMQSPSGPNAPSFSGWFQIHYDPLSQRVLMNTVKRNSAGVASNSIYASDMFSYNSLSNSFTHISGTGSPGPNCTADLSNMPGDRHPYWQQTIDTKRNRLWMVGGANQTCDGSIVSINGTTVNRTSGNPFDTSGSWNGVTIKINNTQYVVASVQSTTGLTLTSSAGVQNNVFAQLAEPYLPLKNTYYMTLNSNPAQNTWTRLSNASLNIFAASMTYSPDDDVLFMFGGANYFTTNYVYCPTDLNPTPGTLTAKQTAAGCNQADRWVNITSQINGGAGAVAQPPGFYNTGIVYDTVNKKVIQYGAQNGTTVNQNETWAYDIPTKTWTKKCQSGCVPPPLPISAVANQPMTAYNKNTGKVLYHLPKGPGNAPSDWEYDYAVDRWTQMDASGMGPNVEGAMSYDSSTNRLITWTNGGSGTPDIWQGQLGGSVLLPPPAPVPPPTSDVTAPTVPQNLSASVVSSSQINLAWTASTDTIGVTGYHIYRGGVQIATSMGNTYSNTGLAASTNYSYTVAAYNAAGNVSGQSLSVNATTQAIVFVPPPLPTGPVITPLVIQEAIYPGVGGVTRSQDPVSVGVPVADSRGITSESQLGISGASAAQFRILGRWPSGNIKWVLVDTFADVTAGGQNTGTALTTGSGNFGGNNLATDNGSTISINTGPAQFIIKKNNFNVVEKATVNGKTIVESGTSQGLVLTGPVPGQTSCGTCTTVYSSVNDALSTAVIEENGPVKTVIKAMGSHKDASGNAYMNYTVRLYFYKNKTHVKVTSILRNAEYGKSNTFASAYKGFEAYELRISPNISGTVNYTIATDGQPQTGTLTGSDDAYLYQGQTNKMQWNECPDGPTKCNVTPDKGFSVIKNNSVLYSRNEAYAPQGWADVRDGSGAGVEIGVYQMGAYFPKSLEFNNGGTDVRIGIFPSQNSQAVYQAWPQYSIHDLFLNFYDSAPASPANEFLKFQHYLTARADRTYYNSANVFPYPIPSAADEDNFYQSTGAASNPVISTDRFCCIQDFGITDSRYPLSIYRFFNWGAGGGPSLQEEFRWSNLQTFLKRGHTGRYLNSAHFYRLQAEKAWPHSDGFNWRDKTHAGLVGAELDGHGDPIAVSLNSGNSFNNWVTWDHNHLHWYGMADYYFMSGDETIKDSMMDMKDHYLNNDTYQGYPRPGTGGPSRAVGIVMIGSSRYSDFLSAVGDPDASSVLSHALRAYTLEVKPDFCVSGYPEGCVPTANPAQTNPPGTSRVRGIHNGEGNIGSDWCGVQETVRSTIPYQASLLVEGVLSLRRTMGASWSEYENALDLTYGISQWALSENYSDNGSLKWREITDSSGNYGLYNGFRYGVLYDRPQICPLGTPIVSGLLQIGGNIYDSRTLPSSQQGLWMHFYVQNLVNGGLTTDQVRKAKLQMQQVALQNYAYAADFGQYQIGTIVSAVKEPSGLALQNVPVTVTPQGSSYRLSWIVPANTQSYRIKWGPKQIVEWIGFDPLTNTFIGDPVNTMNWFAANNITNEPAPSAAGTTQTLTLTGLPTGLTSANFSVKAYISGGALPSSIPLPPPPPVDVAPPVISNLVGSNTTQTGTLITWNTDESSDTQVEYGLTASYGSATTLNSALSTTHSATLSSLSPATLYHFRVKSRDALGNLATTQDFTFTTLSNTSSIPSVSVATTTATTSPITSSQPSQSTSATPSLPTESLPSTTYIPALVAIKGNNGDTAPLPVRISPSPVISQQTSPQTYSYTPLTRTLSRTLSGADVAVLQTFLTSLGLLPPNNITGLFGPLTESAVQAFQRTNNIVSSGSPASTGYGVVGLKTRTAINTLLASTTSGRIPVQSSVKPSQSFTSSFSRNLSLGMTGNDVKLLQQFLNTQGFTVSVYGPGSLGQETTTFGRATWRALISYQKAMGIMPASGFFGPITRGRVEKR